MSAYDNKQGSSGSRQMFDGSRIDKAGSEYKINIILETLNLQNNTINELREDIKKIKQKVIK